VYPKQFVKKTRNPNCISAMMQVCGPKRNIRVSVIEEFLKVVGIHGTHLEQNWVWTKDPPLLG
jgi:hypothetical protein